MNPFEGTRCSGSAAPARASFDNAARLFALAAAGACGESAPGVARNRPGALACLVDARARPTTARCAVGLP